MARLRNGGIVWHRDGSCIIVPSHIHYRNHERQRCGRHYRWWPPPYYQSSHAQWYQWTPLKSAFQMDLLISSYWPISFPVCCTTDVKISSLIYFGISGFILFMCIVGYFVLLRLPITKYYRDLSEVCPFPSITEER